jgi:peptidoglycan/xylan/chitin deacetylase (PgdA/CDA1 family)/glycosyltransferase involved in cell wall biosynthesis/SAM-dependent methyltransferase
LNRGRIAVVITCRDLGRFVLEALESVERQTRPAAEIVVVDDRSGDIRTRQVLARLEREGTRVVGGDGRGASAARNLGARLTSADYLVWLDADDTLEAGYFDLAGEHLDASPEIDFVSCAMRAFGAASYVWTPSKPTFVDVVATGAVPHASTMMRRQLWEAIGGFDESVPSFELLDFWASAIDRGFSGVVLDEPLLNYRVRPGSGYRRSIQESTYRSRLEQFYLKHHTAVEQDALELILAKEAFLVSQREYRQTLQSRSAALEAELVQLKTEIADVARALERHGRSRVEWGDLRRTQPISEHWGRDRGKPIDRHYIDRFLDGHRADIRGAVLEVRDSTYTEHFGGAAVTSRDVIDVDGTNGAATVVSDLRSATAIPSSTYDCVILTQTLHMIDDMSAAVAECARILRPGGVLLATAPSVIRVDDEAGVDGDFWRLTEASARKLFAEAFPVDAFDVTPYGNVTACTAFLHGLSVEELALADVDYPDATFPLLIAIRAVKPAMVVPRRVDRTASSVSGSGQTFSAVVLAYHRISELAPDSHALCTPSDEFQRHMAYVRDYFTPIGLDELVRAAASGRIPERAVAVTLDDGYLDALTVASRILGDVGVPATFFVNSDRLDELHERFWDVLERVFLSGAALPSALPLKEGGHDLRLSTVTASERAEALDCVNRMAWPLTADGRAGLLAMVLEWSGLSCAPRASHRVLTGDELRALADRPGCTIGAHSVHHLALTTQAAETKRWELAENKDALERTLGRPVNLFSYPYGDFDAETIAAVRRAGFHAAVTVDAALFTSGTNRLLIPRCEVTPRQHGNFAQFMQEVFADRREQVTS